MGAKAIPITEEILKHFPESWCHNLYYIGSGSEEKNEIFYVYSDKIRGTSQDRDYDEDFRPLYSNILPVIELLPETLIDEENWIISDLDYEGDVPKEPNSEIIKNMIRKDRLNQMKILKKDIKDEMEEIFDEMGVLKKMLSRLEKLIEDIEEL